ncbi:MAG TPA: inositol monophosphatase [Candidatus Saccharimonadia bacterium]|jgi:fructose-1,6-bisphosphatase/inositol monophosphatase family enzyme|nr:inositol monophosphatase [Candidatus Saccharimonadia bacterium]
MTFQDELEFAKTCAERAGEIMLHYWDADQHIETKGDGTPVTIADKTVNRMVIEAVAKRFPDDGTVGEEESSAQYGHGRRWICDPIDGTSAYVAGLPSATFSLALVVDGRPMVAVAYEPLRKQLFWAVRGQGSYANERRLHVSTRTFEQGPVALPPDYIKAKLVNEPFMQKLLAFNKELVLFSGAVYRSCMVASGRIAGFPHPRVKPYDIAAVHLIVEEAGGKVTATDGSELDYSTDFRGAVISNGVAHDDLLKLFS